MEYNNKCPVCGATAAVSMSFDFADILLCRFCKHYFSINTTIPADAIYNSDYFDIKHKNYFQYQDTILFDDIISNISRKGGLDLDIIDIGCGKGSFLDYLFSLGYKKLHGLDIIDLKSIKFNYIKTSIDDFHTEKKFDIVTSLANIEHIKDVDYYMSKLAQMIKDDGLILIYTTNSHSLLYSSAVLLYRLGIKFAAIRLFDPHHLNHFSTRSLSVLASKYNLKSIHLLIKNFPINSIDLEYQKNSKIILFAIIAIHALSKLLHKGYLQLQVYVKVD